MYRILVSSTLIYRTLIYRGSIFHTLAVSITTLLLCGLSVAQERSTFTVGAATARRGQKVTGVIAVPAGVDAGTNIPVAVVHGAKPGPVLALVSGAHGTE